MWSFNERLQLEAFCFTVIDVVYRRDSLYDTSVGRLPIFRRSWKFINTKADDIEFCALQCLNAPRPFNLQHGYHLDRRGRATATGKEEMRQVLVLVPVSSRYHQNNPMRPPTADRIPTTYYLSSLNLKLVEERRSGAPGSKVTRLSLRRHVLTGPLDALHIVNTNMVSQL